MPSYLTSEMYLDSSFFQLRIKTSFNIVRWKISINETTYLPKQQPVRLLSLGRTSSIKAIALGETLPVVLPL